MTRNLSSLITDELAKQTLRLAMLFEGEFEDGRVYLTNFSSDITYNGNTYVAVGGLVGIDTIRETLAFQQPGTIVYLSGLNATAQALVTSQKFVGNEGIITTVFLDENYAVVGGYESFRGSMDGYSLTDSFDQGEMTLQIPLTFEFARFDEVVGRRTNSSEQRSLFAGDAFFDSVATLSLQTINW